MISGTRIRAEIATGIHGRRVVKPAHAPQKPARSGLGGRCSQAGRASELMRRPATAISAGSSVTAASTAMATATAAV